MEHKKYHFEKLTPVNDIDISVYEEAIDYIFDNEDITNVAISGSYSAGKSSVINIKLVSLCMFLWHILNR